jgi:hypothetical protein
MNDIQQRQGREMPDVLLHVVPLLCSAAVLHDLLTGCEGRWSCVICTETRCYLVRNDEN